MELCFDRIDKRKTVVAVGSGVGLHRRLGRDVTSGSVWSSERRLFSWVSGLVARAAYSSTSSVRGLGVGVCALFGCSRSGGSGVFVL